MQNEAQEILCLYVQRENFQIAMYLKSSMELFKIGKEFKETRDSLSEGEDRK